MYKRILAVISILGAVAYVAIPRIVRADGPSTLPPYASTVQRVEHDSISVDLTRCAHLSVSVANDAGTLSTADGGVISSELSYICTVPGAENDVCLTQGASSGTGSSCNFSLRIAAGSMTYPISFWPSPDGGAPMVTGLAAISTSDVTCCPVVGKIARSR